MGTLFQGVQMGEEPWPSKGITARLQQLMNCPPVLQNPTKIFPSFCKITRRQTRLVLFSSLIQGEFPTRCGGGQWLLGQQVPQKEPNIPPIQEELRMVIVVRLPRILIGAGTVPFG